MSKQASKAIIGAFVVGALALAVSAVVVFGTGTFLKQKQKFVLFFDRAVKGLNVGSPVYFRGVKIGAVTDILLRADPTDLSIEIPVLIEIDPGRVEGKGLDPYGSRNPREILRLLVERGLRARLQLQSVVTAQLMVAMDFYPGTEVRLKGTDTEYPEIPTITSSLEELSRTFEKLSMEELASQLTSAIAGIERMVNSPDVSASLRNLSQTLKGFHDLINLFRQEASVFTPAFTETVQAVGNLARHADGHLNSLTAGIEETGKEVQQMVRNVNGRVTRLATALETTVKSADAALVQAEKAFGAVRGVAGVDSAVIYELTNALKELSAAARSIRIWAEYLERHPEALLRGKRGPSRR